MSSVHLTTWNILNVPLSLSLPFWCKKLWGLTSRCYWVHMSAEKPCQTQTLLTRPLWESWELWFQDMDSFYLCRSTWVSPICRLRLSTNQKSMDEVGEFVWRPGVVTEALQRGRQVICLEKYFPNSTSMIFCQVASSRGCGQGAGRGKLGHRSRKRSFSNKWILYINELQVLSNAKWQGREQGTSKHPDASGAGSLVALVSFAALGGKLRALVWGELGFRWWQQSVGKPGKPSDFKL